jgi:hypothetical protein
LSNIDAISASVKDLAKWIAEVAKHWQALLKPKTGTPPARPNRQAPPAPIAPDLEDATSVGAGQATPKTNRKAKTKATRQ